MIIIMLGAPASGKGSVSEILSKELNIPAVSSGDIFRKHISEGTEIGKKLNEYVTKGELVPDSIVLEMLEARLNEEDAKKISLRTDCGGHDSRAYSMWRNKGFRQNRFR